MRRVHLASLGSLFVLSARDIFSAAVVAYEWLAMDYLRVGGGHVGGIRVVQGRDGPLRLPRL